MIEFVGIGPLAWVLLADLAVPKVELYICLLAGFGFGANRTFIKKHHFVLLSFFYLRRRLHFAKKLQSPFFHQLHSNIQGNF